jgi:hypothetical protein
MLLRVRGGCLLWHGQDMIRTTAGLLLAWTLFTCHASDAALGVCEVNGVPDYIRSFDCRLAKAIASGLERSKTFRQLVERVGCLQGIVYIEAQYYVRLQTGIVLPGALAHTVTKAGPYRILRVLVGPHSGDRPIVVLAHELQHAVEVLESDATTETEIDELFERIGVRASTGSVETLAARKVERAVARELSAAHGRESLRNVTSR